MLSVKSKVNKSANCPITYLMKKTLNCVHCKINDANTKDNAKVSTWMSGLPNPNIMQNNIFTDLILDSCLQCDAIR